MNKQEVIDAVKGLSDEDRASALAEIAAEGVKHWMLSWDIPEDDLASLVRTKIRPYAVMVHESGYMVHANCKTAVEEIVKEAVLVADKERTEKGLAPLAYTRLRWLPADRLIGDQIVMDWTKERAEVFSREITESFETRMARVMPAVEKLIATNELDVNERTRETRNRRLAILRDLKHRVEDAEAAFVWFAMTDDVKKALGASKDLFEAELKVLREESEAENEKRRAARKAVMAPETVPSLPPGQISAPAHGAEPSAPLTKVQAFFQK